MKAKMKKQDFNFELPEELIAQDPIEVRSSSRLMLVDKELVRFLIKYLKALLVI